MNNITLDAKVRKDTGRKVKRLRKEGILPANIFGKNIKSESIQVDLSQFSKVFKEAGETSIVEINLDGKKLPVLIHNIQYDSVSELPIHSDFLQVNLKEKVVAHIPVELRGESSLEKQGLGTVVQYVNEIEVEALPGDLPEKYEIDLSLLTEIDQLVEVKDLKVDKTKVEIKEDLDKIIVKVEPPKKEEEVAPTEAPSEETVAETPDEKAAGEVAAQESSVYESKE